MLLGIPLSLLVVGVSLWAAALFWLPSTVSYLVDGESLQVKTRLAGLSSTRAFSLDAIEEVEPVDLRGGRRLFGTAMPGYCVGRFGYRDMGQVWQATNCAPETLLLRLAGEPRPLVVSPSDPDLFSDAVTRRQEYVGKPSSVTPGPGWTVFKMLVLGLAGVAFVVPVIFFVAPQRLRYSLRSGELVVTTVLRSRVFSLDGVSAGRHKPALGLKIWGSALPGYYTGRFRMDGEGTRVYASARDEGVLLTGPYRLFVTPGDTEGFLQALETAKRG